MILTKLVPLLAASLFVVGQNVTETGALPSFSPTPVSTSVPSASSSPDTPVPGQGDVPEVQIWCEDGQNATYCPGLVRPSSPKEEYRIVEWKLMNS
jgi:alpha,alpha-trehalase